MLCGDLHLTCLLLLLGEADGDTEDLTVAGDCGALPAGETCNELVYLAPRSLPDAFLDIVNFSDGVGEGDTLALFTMNGSTAACCADKDPSLSFLNCT